MSKFVHLHTHSHYSLLDALPKVDELVGAAKKQGFSALALTDHGNMYGAIEFYEECEKQGIKPIIGLEAYVAPGSRFDKHAHDERPHHLVLLALNYTGYKNLMMLTSLGYTEGMHLRPRIDKELLQKYHEGLLALSGCIEGEIPRIIYKEKNLAKAKKIAQEYVSIFGAENFYLELLDLPAQEGQMEANTGLIKISKETGIPLVVTRDTHYLDSSDAEAQDILTCIREGRVLEDPNRVSMSSVDYSFVSGAEIAERFKHVPEALENTVKIAERVDLKLELNKWHFPELHLPEGETADTFLKKQVYEKLPTLLDFTEEVQKRADYELEIIAKKGYSPYFLVVADYVKYARDHDIVETTRGSGAGSIVSYAMGITTVNPLYFKLPFERFLNPFRPSPPDIDADFADDRRDEMIEYVTKKYGVDKVAQIITFGTMMARGAIRDVGRALGYSYGFCDQLSKLIPFGAQGFHMTIKKALDLEPDLKELYNKNPQAHRLIDIAQKVEGCARHTSIHAAGVVISPTPLTDFTPIQFETGGDKITTQYEMHAVEAAGVLKMDFLGIRNLSILGHAVEIVQKTTGQKVDIYNVPWDDAKTYEMLARGETIGVFQLSGSGMTRYLKELKPTTIFDIMAMVALFRPGPMEVIPEYIKRKHHPELVEYIDPRMKEYLDQSLGLIVYQDDVLLTAINLAGYNWEEADKFRKAMGKKIPEEMMKQKEKFFKGCKEIGKLKPEIIEVLWKRIEPFAAYGFNKAHAASYGVVAYQTGYMKANFPIQYMTAILIAESGDIDKVPEIIHECERMGVKVLPPDINESFKNFAMITPENGEEAHIRFGLSGIKNLGDHIAEVMYRERKDNGTYSSLENFLSRVRDKDLNKKSLESLIKCGALDSFGYDRGVLLHNSDNLLSFVKQIHGVGDVQQHSLFSGTTIDFTAHVRIDAAPIADEQHKLTWEKELLGLYVTAHPFKNIQAMMGKSLTPIKDMGGFERSAWVVVGGVIEKAKKKITRSGKAMMFIKIQDITGSLELLVFPKTYETTKDIWIEGKLVCVIGKTGETEGDDKLFVEKAYEVTVDNAVALAAQVSVGQKIGKTKQEEKNAPRSHVSLIGETMEIRLLPQEVKEKSEAIKTVLYRFPGDKVVILVIDNKKIKTSFSVDDSKTCIDELEAVFD